MPVRRLGFIAEVENLCKKAKRLDAKGGDRGSLALQNILAAPRGPDNANGTVKLETTARVRAACTPSYDGSVYSGIPSVEAAGKSGPHFRGHIEFAVEAMETLGITPRED